MQVDLDVFWSASSKSDVTNRTGIGESSSTPGLNRHSAYSLCSLAHSVVVDYLNQAQEELDWFQSHWVDLLNWDLDHGKRSTGFVARS